MKSYICNQCRGLEDDPPECMVLDSGWGKPSVCPMDGTDKCDFKEKEDIIICNHITIDCRKLSKNKK